MRERVLDIGIREGGDYLWNNLDKREIVGVDLDQFFLRRLHDRYPHVLAVTADARQLPFEKEAFDALEVRFPDRAFIWEGLSPVAERDPTNGWYGELARVLKPRGTLTLWVDPWIDEERVGEVSRPYFSVRSAEDMTVEELKTMGDTYISGYYLEKIKEKGEDIDLLTQSTKIILERRDNPQRGVLTKRRTHRFIKGFFASVGLE